MLKLTGTREFKGRTVKRYTDTKDGYVSYQVAGWFEIAEEYDCSDYGSTFKERTQALTQALGFGRREWAIAWNETTTEDEDMYEFLGVFEVWNDLVPECGFAAD